MDIRSAGIPTVCFKSYGGARFTYAHGHRGGWWSGIGRVGSIVSAALLNWVYKLIARNRRRLSPGPEQCLVPTPAQRSRFLG